MLGVFSGIIAGSIPGLGIIATVLSLTPILIDFTATQILIFYISLIIASQYFGSVVATYFGVPGEITSLPAVLAGHPFMRQNKANTAIAIAAIGSLLASIFAVIFLYANMQWIQKQVWMYSSTIHLIFCAVVIFYLLFYQKKYFTNFILVILGLVLGGVGNFYHEPRYNFNFGLDHLMQGVDKNMLILFAFVVPQIFLHTKNHNIKQSKIISFTLSTMEALCLWLKLRWSWVRGVLIGCVSGLMPAVGTSFSSNFAYALEKVYTKRKSKQLMSAESANNSAMITSLIPLILFGLPIVTSEALVLALMHGKGEPIGLNWFMTEELGVTRFEMLIAVSLIVSFVVYTMATQFAFKLTALTTKMPVWFRKYGIPSLLFFVFIYLSYNDGLIYSSLTTIPIAALIMVPVIRKKIDTLPLIFAMLLSQTTFTKIIVVFSL